MTGQSELRGFCCCPRRHRERAVAITAKPARGFEIGVSGETGRTDCFVPMESSIGRWALACTEYRRSSRSSNSSLNPSIPGMYRPYKHIYYTYTNTAARLP